MHIKFIKFKIASNYLGVLTYLYHCRRSENEYKKERFHRLVIPALFLMFFTNLIFAFSPTINEDKVRELTFFNQFAILYRFPYNPRQSWFCIDLYIYAYVLKTCFLKWHPSHNGEININACVNENSGFGQRMKSKLTHSSFRLIYFVIPKNADEFYKCTNKMLLGPIKLILGPATGLSVIELLFRRSFPNDRERLWNDWCNHLHFLFLYFLGYAIISIESTYLAIIFDKYGVIYLCSGAVFLLLQVTTILVGRDWLGDLYDNDISYVLVNIFRCFGEWMLMVGLYAISKRICTKNFRILKILREMAMPFYLLQLAVIRLIRLASLWISFLDSFLITLILSTICTGGYSLLIVKSPSALRYFFGLPSHDKTFPGQWLKGYGPFIFLVCVGIIECIIANSILSI